jgi:hypothetical protein
VSLGEVVLGPRAPRRARAALVHGIAAARLTLEVDLGLRARAAALAFEALDTAVRYDELVAAIAEDTGVCPAEAPDGLGYRWLVFSGVDVEDLAIGISLVAESFEQAGSWEQLMCAVFAFEPQGDASAVPVYLVYNLARGAFYAFVPRGDDRDAAEERRVQAVLSDELRVEPDAESRYPLWNLPVTALRR